MATINSRLKRIRNLRFIMKFIAKWLLIIVAISNILGCKSEQEKYPIVPPIEELDESK